ncbi:MAG: NAD(P)/FAD-dependent oxidoreductase [Pseudomonadota bacterium]
MKRVIIIGAGPAGLTAALELLRSGQAIPIVLEASNEIGGISRTIVYKGNRMDIGGHRFFSKSDWVMQWWRDILPIHSGGEQAETLNIHYQNQQRPIQVAAGQGADDRVMLVRQRLSRIYFLRKYFDYPIKLNRNTLANLGLVRLFRIGLSYTWAMLFPRRHERSLEDFLVNRFGAELYRTFFKDYTEKVWGVPCAQISAEWGAQRIKGLSVMAAIRHALRKKTPTDSVDAQQATETSLIEKFLYPKLGPGQLWEEVARQVLAAGGEIHLNRRVSKIFLSEGGAGEAAQTGRISGLEAVDTRDSAAEVQRFDGDHFMSTMPVKDLIEALSPAPPEALRRIASALPYRDFMTVGLLLSKMRPNQQAQSAQASHTPPDNWIYIQERDVRIGRLQVFNNWSPHLVAEANTVWLGLEYFCQEGDDLWTKPDAEMIHFAAAELEKIGMIFSADVLDGTVVRVPKTYPAYFGSYAEFDQIRHFVDAIDNLFLIGRNGMHRYNNQDHSMLTAKLAVAAILADRQDKTADKAAIWAVNVDDAYHEEK